MNWLKRQRIRQLIKYGWKDSAKISKDNHKGRLLIFGDIIYCFYKYYVFSNQYVANKLWVQNERELIAKTIGSANKKHDNWGIDNYKNRKFIKKWSALKWGCSKKGVILRNKAYAKQFNAEEGFSVQHHVDIHREHFLDGTISIGKNVLLAKNVFIDYSGDIVIGDDVKISDGVLIETHSHEGFSNLSKVGGTPHKEKLIIHEGAFIGSRAVILESCHEIGRHSRIGGGAVVRTKVPPYAVMTGNPAKIVAFIFSPQAMKEFEEEHYSEEHRISFEEYENIYKKTFSSKLQSIKAYTKKSI